MAHENILEDGRPKVTRNVMRVAGTGLNWVPLFCGNCHKDSGTFVPEENCNFAFYLCNPCAEKWSPLVDTYVVPDEVFWKKVHEEQIEKYGRELEPFELVEALKDDNNPLTKLCKDRPNFASVKYT